MIFFLLDQHNQTIWLKFLNPHGFFPSWSTQPNHLVKTLHELLHAIHYIIVWFLCMFKCVHKGDQYHNLNSMVRKMGMKDLEECCIFPSTTTIIPLNLLVAFGYARDSFLSRNRLCLYISNNFNHILLMRIGFEIPLLEVVVVSKALSSIINLKNSNAARTLPLFSCFFTHCH